MTRFADQDSVDFDLSEHDARDWSAADTSPDEDDIEYTGGGDTPDDNDTTTNMSNDNSDNDDGDTKSLAEKNAEQFEDVTDMLDELTRHHRRGEDPRDRHQARPSKPLRANSDLRSA